MKKLILTAVIIALALTAAAFAEDLPAVGDTISGFSVKSVEPMDVLGATGVLFEHEKSGAELLYLASEDNNRSFDITFKTPALDDKGKPHVFEHITISGSTKYPDANLFFPFSNQTYSTFVNALTYSGMTSFPVSSLSQEQLMAMMDYYLSGVFAPLLYEEPRLLKREAWRYELSDIDAELNIAGTVYSEMQGARTIERMAAENNRFTLYKGSPVAHVSGGIPGEIAKLTYEELIAFHDAYYHPSNALITLYGNLDIDMFLEYIDSEYLSNFDKKDVYVEMGRVEPFEQTLWEVYDAPVEADAATENASYVYYSFGCDEADMEDTFDLMLLGSYLESESSRLMTDMREAFPEALVSVSVDMDSPTPTVSFVASGVNEDDAQAFVETVDGSLEKIFADGIDQQDWESSLAVQKLSLLLTPETSTLGVNASVNISLGWTYFDRVDFFNVYEKAVNEMTADDATVALGSFLVDNTYRAVAVTRPVAGLAEQNAEELARELALIKSEMSQEELEQLVAESAEFVEWSSASVDPQIIQQLVPVTADSLPEELQHFDIEEKTVDGVLYMTSVAEVSGVAQTAIMLDASSIPVDMLKDVQIYLWLMGELDTNAHTREELSALCGRYMPTIAMSLSASPRYDGDEKIYTADISLLGLAEDAPEAIALVQEMLFESKLDDVDDIVDILSRFNSATRNSYDANALNVQRSRLAAAKSVDGAFNLSVSSYGLYPYIAEMIENPDTITQRLEAARDFILNKNGAIVVCAGSEDAIASYMGEVESLMSNMSDVSREKVDYSGLCPDIESEVVVNNSTVHMNILYDTGKNFTGKDVVLTSLINDAYLLPNLRNAYGAYGAYASFNQFASYIYTYRDPNVALSFATIQQLPEFLRTVELTQEDIDRYIIGSYNSLNSATGQLTGAITALSNALSGLTEKTRLDWMAQAKSTTVEDVRAMADKIDDMLENGIISTSGTLTSVADSMELFESVYRLEDLSSEQTSEQGADEAA
ncbi:MAG: insulinase family protein [Clostridia bacterium]|nr:insulinase family protein [Clostridia bacterium]